MLFYFSTGAETSWTSVATTTTNSSLTHIWTTWVETVTVGCNTAIWTGWAGDQQAGSGQQQGSHLTLEQVAAIREHQRREELAAVERHRAAVARQREVDERASELLRHYLSEKQRADLARHSWFLVDGASGARYRIKRGCSLTGNIEVLNQDGSVRHRLCGHDRVVGTPHDDQILAQKFYLEHHEEEFLRIANRH